MSSIDITAAKLKGDFCDYSFKERTLNGSQQVEVKDCEVIIHDDLRDKFRQLIPHLAFICDQVKDTPQLEEAIEDMKATSYGDEEGEHFLSNFNVTGFKISGSGDNQGVTLIGQRKLLSGKVLNLVTPFIRYEDEYLYMNELRIAVSECQEEVAQYMQGKKAPDAQLSLFDGEEDVQVDVTISEI